MILFGHQTGNPNAHHAALALEEAGLLGAYCTPWYPQPWEIQILQKIPGIQKMANRFSRRRFGPLDSVPKIQGRPGEFGRLLIRALGREGAGLSYQTNDWMMERLSREIRSPKYRAVYTYEDCALKPFQSAKEQDKIAIYDLPTSCYAWWQSKELELAKKYRDWLPPKGIGSRHFVRPAQKKKEMELADVVVTACGFARDTIREFSGKKTCLAPYGVDLPTGWETIRKPHKTFRVIFAGTVSVHKGVPLLLETWRRLGWKDAELVLAGSWQLATQVKNKLPRGVVHLDRIPRPELMNLFCRSDWLVLPSNSEGYGLVILEALAHGLPVLASTATGAADLPASRAVRLFDPENPDQLAEELLAAKAMFGKDLGEEARKIAAGCTWEAYRKKIREAVLPLLG